MQVKMKAKPREKYALRTNTRKPTIDIESSSSALVLPVTRPLSDSNTVFRFFRRISRSNKATCLHLTWGFENVKKKKSSVVFQLLLNFIPRE